MKNDGLIHYGVIQRGDSDCLQLLILRKIELLGERGYNDRKFN
ncbi:hypothetical protein ACVBE9_00080 [Eionea flava]